MFLYAYIIHVMQINIVTVYVGLKITIVYDDEGTSFFSTLVDLIERLRKSATKFSFPSTWQISRL